jgi:predicted nuclease of restriction endonuclease-like (RecB) superfamily
MGIVNGWGWEKLMSTSLYGCISYICIMKALQEETYQGLLAELKQKISEAQVKAVVSVNRQLLYLYYEVGQLITQKLEQSQWGDKVLDQLSKDISTSFPSLKGFSKTNIKYIQRFASTYTAEIGQQAVDQLGLHPVFNVSWGHNIVLLTKLQTNEQRVWYAQKSIENGWSRNVLAIQIESRLIERSGKAISNFQQTLPSHQSDLAQQTLKDPYIFDFLTIESAFREREIEQAITEQITHFLLELGKGFAFVGKQYHLQIGDNDYYIDLLFYHVKLHSFVAVELKMGRFKPEYAGKMNFYLSALDDLVKSKEDNASIGIIMCLDQKGNTIDIEYALKDINKPIGVADFKLSNIVPDEYKSSLPTIEELEMGLENLE